MSRGGEPAGRSPSAPDPPHPRTARSRPLYRVAKRALDVGLCLVQGVLCLPAWILVPLAVKLEDGGPVFYGQRRVGRGGELFTSWKFRSMTPRGGGDDRDGGDDRGEASGEGRGDVDRGGADGDGRPRAAADAPLPSAELELHRVTRVGRALRATALDELPQLWNILRGDMSYVGPRALLPEERVDAASAGRSARRGKTVRLDRLPGYRERHSVRPGLTGLAQIRAPRDAPHRTKFRYDLFYVRHRSLRMDLWIIAVSVWISLRGAWPEVGRGGAV